MKANPTESGYYWVRETPAGTTRLGFERVAGGWEVAFWDAEVYEWWAVGLDYPTQSESITDHEDRMHDWVGPLTPPKGG